MGTSRDFGQRRDFRNRPITFAQQNAVPRFELRQVLGQMDFCLMNVQIDHGRKVNELMNLVKGPIIALPWKVLGAIPRSPKDRHS